MKRREMIQQSDSCLQNWIESIHDTLSELDDGKDRYDALHEAIDYEISRMYKSTVTKLISEYGTHYAYQEYYEEYGMIPSNDLAILYHCLFQLYTNVYHRDYLD